MRTAPVLLLLCVGAAAFSSVCSTVQTETCRTGAGLTAEQCTDMDGPVQNFLTCAGVPEEPGADHILNLKGLISAALDVYSFMRSSVSGVPVLDLSGGFSMNEDHMIRAWLDIKLTPLLSSISRNFLTCLSNRNFSCSTYQTVVKELSQHFSGLDPVRQKWIYSFFMYPFLSRNTTSGCVDPEDSTEDWLIKNFGSFSVVAQVQDFTSINLLFSGLEVLHLLSPEQKAELLLHPAVGLTDSSLSLVFQSLLSSLSPSNNGMMYLSPSSPLDPLGQALNGFMTAFTPVGSFVKQFVSLTKQQNLSGMRSATLVQALINLTLAEIAAPFKQNSTQQQQVDLVTFDPLNVNDWFEHVVSPILRRFLPQDQAVHPNLTAVFHNQFYIETGMGSGAQNESQDICSVFIDNRTCGLTDLVEHVATVLHCASQSNLTLNEETLLTILMHLSQNLDALLQQLSMTNFSSQSSPFSDILDHVVDDTFTMSNLQDVSFVRLWFQVKLKPLLSTLTPEYLTCLSHKDFSCQTFQILVSELSANMFLMSDEGLQNVYQYFIFSFLSRQNASGGCPAENSTVWLTLNLGEFAPFATLSELYQLNPHFNPLDALVVLSPGQTAELIVEDFPGLPEKSVIINMVFNYILISPEERGLLEMLDHLIVLADQMGLECSSYQLIVQRLQESVVPPHMIQSVSDHISQLEQMAPSGCFVPVTCISTPINETQVCGGVNSSAVQQYLNNGDATDQLCGFSVTEYACTPMLNMTVDQLVSVLSCQLTASADRWKLFLSRVSQQLDDALSTLSSRWAWWGNSSSSVVLDVLRELRLDKLTDDGAVALWFEDHLRPFLPFASKTFLQCLHKTNFSCQNFQIVVKTFSAGFSQMNENQRQITVTDFILPFLSRDNPGAACVSDDSYQWLSNNFGQFSSLVPLDQLISLNPQFDPVQLSVLLNLSPEQLVELMFNDLPGLPEKAVIINAVFDQLIAPPQNNKIISVLSLVVETSNTGNISCALYQLIFHRLDHLMVIVPALETQILRSKSALLQNVPQGCVSSSGQCGFTPANVTALCQSVNSSALSTYLSSAHDSSHLCEFSIVQYTCAQLTDLSAPDLATVLSCGLNGNQSVSDETWKLFIQKVNPVLGPALDLLPNTGQNKPHPSESFLNMIGEVILSTFSSSSLGNDSFVQLWFDSRLRPFLPYASETFLSCLSTRDFSCDTFRRVVGSFSQSFDIMSSGTRANVYIDFIKAFLSRNDTAGCVDVSQSSSDWLIGSFGRFSIFTTITELQMLNPSFSVLDTLGLLSVNQLAQVSSTPGLLSSAAAVNNLLLYVPDAQFTAFYTSLSGALQVQNVSLPPLVQDAFLEQVFVRANLTMISDDNLVFWIQNILPFFIENISVQHVTTLFNIVQQRPCPISQQAVQMLSLSSSTFQPAAQEQIYQLILGSLTGPTPLRCYTNQSYYAFLTSSFMTFQFPNLTTFLSLIPASRTPELMASISPAEVSSLFSRPDVVDDPSKICQFFTNYPKTPQYLQTEPPLHVALARQVLSCVWPQVLKVEDPAEVNQWFGSRLVQYLPLLTPALVAPDVMQKSSCLSFRKFVSVMAKFNYSAVDFSQSDIYNTILVYVNTSSSSTPKCYNASDPVLNSTAWFVDYISVFLSFVTLDDLLHFGLIEPFTDNLENLQLFDQIDVPGDVMDFYVSLLFDKNPSFSAYYLPLSFLCLAPASSFSQLSPQQLKNVSSSVQQTCSDIQPDVSAALASSVEEVTENTLVTLGQFCSGLSTAQISGAGGNVLLNSLFVLKTVTGWNLDQAMMIIQTLLMSGVYQINSAVSLQNLGSLIIGVQTSIINQISGGVLIQALQSQSLLSSLTGAPVVLQQTFVNQIITVNSSSDAVITNVPDVLALEIPRTLLLGVSSSPAAAQTVNQKTWKREQAVFLFESVATQFSDPNAMSFQVLQGFTCSRIQNFGPSKVMGLIRGCRRRGNQTLVLQESQLTCMYYYIKNSDVNAFSQYPAEVLIYYNYSLINSSQCVSYFSTLGTANFSVLSSALSFKIQTLFNNARECLGISGFSITQNQMDVLGNMCCFLSADYIQNSDPYILEKLKPCSQLTSTQISAIESQLLSGNTSYGSSVSWNRTTLENLGMLPLYLTANIWSKFTQPDKQRYLKVFIRDLRKNNKASEMQILSMMNEVNKITRVRIRRAADSVCTAGQITQAQVYSDMFPFAFDVTQFNACLSVQTLKDNLEAITDRVYDRSYQRILLDKLNQVYPAGLPDEVLQVLGSTSRAATSNDVIKWNITKIDTLSSLMNSAYGDWDPDMVQLLVRKYLSVNGNTLGTTELNALGGANLCALNTSVLSTITADSLQRASALSLTNCSSEKMTLLFGVAQNAFAATNTRSTNTISVPTYQLLQAYIGGADAAFIRGLVNSNVNMDVPTFMTLQQSVINVLNVTEVKGLLGVNVGDLKTYESTPQIQTWIKLQLQTDLNTLLIGLTGGRNSTAAATTTSTAAASTSSTTSSTKAPSATGATTGAGSRLWSPVRLQLFLLAVAMTVLQLLH